MLVFNNRACCGLLLLAALAHSKPSKPTTRFTRFARLSLNVKSKASDLGYSEGTWNKVNAALERNRHSSLPDSILDDINRFMDASSSSKASERWDCWVNHYRGYSWGDLDNEGVQDEYKTLGWTSAKWNGLDGNPASENTFFNQLSKEEQAAAANLCYEDWSWPKNNGAFPDPDGISGGTSLACFSGLNEVQVRGKGHITVDQLKIGDYVMAGNGDFSRIYSFSHFDPLLVLEYLQIYFVGVQKPLEISREHMVLANNKMLRAGEVQTGHVLGGLVVKEITSIQRQGAYAPVTEAGDIIVSGAIASCYVAILDHAPVDQHLGTHALLSPLRLLCTIDFGICEHETYTNGYSDWIYKLMKIVQSVNAACGPNLQAVASFAVWPLVMAVYLVVELLIHPFLLLAASLGALLFWHGTFKRFRVKAL